MSRLKPLLVTLAVTGALAGGGAAIASAASTTSTTATTTSSTAASGTTGGSGSTAPAQAPHPGSGNANRSSHHCPNM
ncbi:MAG TPA: hypothetical protein VMP89_11360 [Solirubrobacteraceae bacterium]|nr:hypothetical protein [Solirubrobacteraceae bacterium]